MLTITQMREKCVSLLEEDAQIRQAAVNQKRQLSGQEMVAPPAGRVD